MEQFIINSYQYLPNPWDIKNDVEWMLYAQHYGVPTRLMDFTTSHITSLLFAVEKSFQQDCENDAVVYFLNSKSLNMKYKQQLSIIKDFNGFYFSDLPLEDQVELMSRRVSTITFRNFPGKEFELEIFNRYNKGTKPLTPQEIRHAVFDSRVNQFVSVFCNNLMNGDDKELFNAYAISKDRYQKKQSMKIYLLY